MVLVFPSLLMVVHHMVVDLPEPLDNSLLVAGVLSTRNLSVESVHHLETIPEIVLHSRSTGLVVKHVEHLAKIHGRAIRSPIPN
uniref:AC5 n=1 Tax=Tomato mosaic severe dwarf virus TaxID=2712833 RepID=A0A7G5F353_9GEMI|nr:AC5 [Tomato mosaic severe dwarf virus]